jgi:predicted phage tail protein
MAKVILDGALGKRFGRNWNLNIAKPADALRIIGANCPDMIYWIRDNMTVYKYYKIFVEYFSGEKKFLSTEDYLTSHESVRSIRFTPVIDGAGGDNGILQIVIGAVAVIAAFFTAGGSLAALGASQGAMSVAMAGAAMMVGGVVQLISASVMSGSSDDNERKDRTNRYFDGPINTSSQGVPVPLIYGEVITGSQPISVNIGIQNTWKPA